MVSGEREVEMTALPIGNNPSIRKLKIAIQKLTDRRPDDLHFFVPQNFRASLLHSWKTMRPQIQSRLSVLVLALKHPSFFTASKTTVSTLILPKEVAQIYVKLTASDSFQDYDDADRENNQATVDSGIWQVRRTITRGATDRITKCPTPSIQGHQRTHHAQKASQRPWVRLKRRRVGR